METADDHAPAAAETLPTADDDEQASGSRLVVSNLRELREGHEMSQRELCKLLQDRFSLRVDQGTFSRIESGDSAPSPQLLDAMRAVFGAEMRVEDSPRRRRPDEDVRTERLNRAAALLNEGRSRAAAKGLLMHEFGVSRSRAYADIDEVGGGRLSGVGVRDAGAPLLEARERLGLSRRALDLEAGVSEGTISALEGVYGHRIGRERAERITTALGGSIDDYFTTERAPPERLGQRIRPALPAHERPDLSKLTRWNKQRRETFDAIQAAGRVDVSEAARRLGRSTRTVLQLAKRHSVGERFRGLGAGNGALHFSEQDVEQLRQFGPESERSLRLHRDPKKRAAWGHATFVKGKGKSRYSRAAKQKWGGIWGGHKTPTPGSRRRGRPETLLTGAQVKQIRDLHARKGPLGEQVIAQRVGVSRRQVRKVLGRPQQ